MRYLTPPDKKQKMQMSLEMNEQLTRVLLDEDKRFRIFITMAEDQKDTLYEEAREKDNISEKFPKLESTSLLPERYQIKDV